MSAKSGCGERGRGDAHRGMYILTVLTLILSLVLIILSCQFSHHEEIRMEKSKVCTFIATSSSLLVDERFVLRTTFRKLFDRDIDGSELEQENEDEGLSPKEKEMSVQRRDDLKEYICPQHGASPRLHLSCPRTKPPRPCTSTPPPSHLSLPFARLTIPHFGTPLNNFTFRCPSP